eukprot:TRINITY_DN3514_c0_g1_i4.p1 TRINITY_DN3514_c0_g1~~TRINITY_DN3514_c0_g1_i4.p1  ORF type:complete len:354 (+),score=51.38 TRINITY_DN3514_c0_g1_i4:100-1161(+)
MLTRSVRLKSVLSPLVGFSLGCTATTGFMLSGMLLPQKIFSFFSVTDMMSGVWQPALLLTFVSALATNTCFYWFTTKSRTSPLLRSGKFSVPNNQVIDRRLILGNVLFGLGWGTGITTEGGLHSHTPFFTLFVCLGGFCPGPSLAAIGLGFYLPALSIAMGIIVTLIVEQKLRFTDFSMVAKPIASLFGLFLILSQLGRMLSAHSVIGLGVLPSDTVLGPIVGGCLIGSAVGLYLLLEGKILGFSGILKGIIEPVGGNDVNDRLTRFTIVLGLCASSIFLSHFIPLPELSQKTPVLMCLGGLLTGIGVTLGNGCTSGHGIAGLARFSKRSFVATLTFMSSAFLTINLLPFLGF